MKRLSLDINQGGGLMNKTLGLSAGRSGVRIPGRGKCLLRTTAVNTRVKYPLYFAHHNTDASKTNPCQTAGRGSVICLFDECEKWEKEQL